MKNEPPGAGGLPLIAKSIAFVVICRSRICLGSTGGYRRAQCSSERECHERNAMKRNVLKIATTAIFSCSGSRTDQLGCLSDGLGSQIKREAAMEGFSQRSIGRGLHRARRAFYESRRLARHAWPYLAKNPFSQYICLPRAHRAVAFPKAPAGQD